MIADNAPRIVGECVITDDLGSNHECGNEEVISGGLSSSDEPGLTLQVGGCRDWKSNIGGFRIPH